jgi:hypothetical protein
VPGDDEYRALVRHSFSAKAPLDPAAHGLARSPKQRAWIVRVRAEAPRIRVYHVRLPASPSFLRCHGAPASVLRMLCMRGWDDCIVSVREY